MKLAVGDSLVSVKAPIGTRIVEMENFIRQELDGINIYLIRDNKERQDSDSARIGIWSYTL